MLAKGTPVKVTSPDGQIYFGSVMQADPISNQYQVRIIGNGPLEWYPAGWVEESE
jgi:hypothetical protein